MSAESDQEGMEVRQEEDPLRMLPDDALAAVLRCLSPRDLAVSCCVRKAWHAIIDDRRLLLPHLLPHKVAGIFIQYNCCEWWEFFARPTTGIDISGELDFLPDGDEEPDILDHCNGLLLGYNRVFNPATRRWAPLPSCPHSLMKEAEMVYLYSDKYLVFDPTISPHYEVLLIPRLASESSRPEHQLDPSIEESEWPPSRYVLHVFSSKTHQWEERLFLRIGQTMGTVSDVWRNNSGSYKERYAAYSQGDLYVTCEANFVMRISLSHNEYQIIKPPVGIKESSSLYLGKSQKGVYCALVNGCSGQSAQLRVWTLNKLCDQMEWVLMHQANPLGSILAGPFGRITGPWTLNDINYYRYRGEDKVEAPRMFEWDSDNDNVIQAEAGFVSNTYFDFLGFHPYKEVVFLSVSLGRGVAYHLNSSKVQELGWLRPRNYGDYSGQHGFLNRSFPYTPCLLGECPPSEDEDNDDDDDDEEEEEEEQGRI